MKKLIASLLLIVLFCNSSLAQQKATIVGSWLGSLNIGENKLRLILHITSQKDNNYGATADSPDQGVKGIPIDRLTYEKDTLKFSIMPIQADYAGIYKNDSMVVGVFSQMGSEFPLTLKRTSSQVAIFKRPQEPKRPYPYVEEEVFYKNKKAGITLSGTLTMPLSKSVSPVVLLISGSGPQDRDEAVMNHKPFLVLADYLTRMGISVLRVDDRGVGKSTGNIYGTSKDFADDVEAGIEYLKTRKEINLKKIGLIGHSEGGIIAPIVAARNKDVAYIVLMAGIGVPGSELLLSQTRESTRKTEQPRKK